MTSVTVSPDSTATVNESRVPKTEIRLCTLEEFKVKADPLFQEHYEEIALRKDLMELKPNWPMYDALDQAGSLFIYLAMQGDVCIGYSMNLVTNHLHYADLKYTQNDVLFIKKEFRGGRIGLRLMKGLPMLFFGGRDSYTFMHYDIDLANIFHFHFEGKKQCILFC